MENSIKLPLAIIVNGEEIIGETIIQIDEILMFHDSVYEGYVNIFLNNMGVTTIRKGLEMEELARMLIPRFKKAFVRFNPNEEANTLGVKTAWKDGQKYLLYYNPLKLNYCTYNDKHFIFPVMGDNFRIEF